MFCHFPLWCPLSEAILNCVYFYSLLSAVLLLIVSLDKKLLLILHVLSTVVKMVCLWKFHNSDKRDLGTCMRLTVNKGKDKCTFTLNQAINFD